MRNYVVTAEWRKEQKIIVEADSEDEAKCIALDTSENEWTTDEEIAEVKVELE